MYVCGLADPAGAVTQTAAAVEPNEGKCTQLVRWAQAISAQLAGAEVVAKQSCHLPMTSDGVPVVGFLGGTGGTVTLAYGHTCWGICQGPGTGVLVAELVADGSASTLDISDLTPARFCPGFSGGTVGP